MSPIDRIRDLLEPHDAGAVLITSLPDIRWACGFSGSNGLLLVSADTARLLTDGRYTEQSAREIAEADAEVSIYIASGNLFDALIEEGFLDAFDRVMLQSDHLSIETFGRLNEKTISKDWVQVPSLLSRLVARKTAAEVERIRSAQAITDAVFDELLAFIEPGLTEQDIAAEIVYRHLRRGASAMSFDPIVAAGPNGALPHARPTSRKLQLHDLVVIDMGCFLDGYASDMTRTIAIGEPEAEAVKVYDTVLKAQKAALANAAAGISSKALDEVARKRIDDAGYGAYFSHSLGHGVGLQIHEWPSISWRMDVELQAGMAITIEPGIYVPGRFGVRIEDLIVLTAEGCDNLTQSPRELIIL